MPTLIERLRSFNRKERFYLLETALGSKTFILDRHFRRRLDETLGLTVPRDAYVAMDYHLDWIALSLAGYGAATAEPFRATGALTEVNKSQIDTDLLVAFAAGRKNHIVLVEAKGATGWNSKQLREKERRLQKMFAEFGKTARAEAHYVLLSPKRPTQLKTGVWLDGMRRNGRLPWVELSFSTELFKATRCDKDKTPSARGRYLKINKKR